MALQAGDRLGPYEVTGAIGAGGMGEVYRARDTTLGRDVALKILPDAFAADPERLARFEREAKTLAALNHPNIAGIHGLQQAGGTRALVMELVEGEDLSARIARGPVPVDEAVVVAGQIVDALEAAHEAGIVHRDLKPANVKVRPDGTVKVLDFGLAKANDPGAASSADVMGSPTMTSPATAIGVILGTAAYMAPEQAKGRPVDKRADIWAFGVVLYEMLTGRSPFKSEDVSETLAAVLTRDLDLDAVPNAVPRSIVRLIGHCVKRDPRVRLRDIGDARPGLVASADEADSRPASGIPFASRPAQVVMAALAVAAVVLGVLAFGGSGTPAMTGVTRASIALPPGHALAAGPEITRDGQRVAFSSTGGSERPLIYTRRLDEADLSLIEGTEGADQLFFSPDGRWIAFYARGGFFKVRVDGGEPIHLADAPSSEGGHWLADGTMIVTTAWNSGLYRLDENGGAPQPLLIPDRTTSYAHVWPSALPDGRTVLFNRWGKNNGLVRFDLADMTETMVAPGQWRRSLYTTSGHIVFSGDGGDLLALPGDRALSETVTPEAVLENVDAGNENGYSRFSVSANGTLVYVPLDSTKKTLVAVDAVGRAETIEAAQSTYEQVTLSPDGRRAVVMSNFDLFVHDLERGGQIALTPEFPNSEHRAVWSRDGARIIFASNHGGTWDIYAKAASGAGAAEQLLENPFDQYPTSVSRSGLLVYEENHDTTGKDIWLLPPGGEPEPWRVTPAEDQQGMLSPDEQLMAFASDVSGRPEIFVQRLDRAGDPIVVSTAGGRGPMWSRSGDRLYFRHGNRIMVCSIDTAPSLSASVPEVVFDGGWALSDRRGSGNYGMMPDGRFLMVHHEPEALPTRINVIFNWFEELRRQVPVR